MSINSATTSSLAAWAVRSTYHTVLKASPGAAIFGQDMLFDILFIADWQKIGEHRQQLTNLINTHEDKGRIDYDYKVGKKVLLWKEGIFCNSESRWHIKLGSLHQSIQMEQSQFNVEIK